METVGQCSGYHLLPLLVLFIMPHTLAIVMVLLVYQNKPAAQAAGQTLPDASPPVGKIHPFSKISVTDETIQQF